MPFIAMHGSLQGLKHAKKALFWSILPQKSVTLFGRPFFAVDLWCDSTFFNRWQLGANLLWRTKKNSVHMSPSIFRSCFSRKDCFFVMLFGLPFFAVELRCISTFFIRRQIGAYLLCRTKQKLHKYRQPVTRTRTPCHLLFCAARQGCGTLKAPRSQTRL